MDEIFLLCEEKTQSLSTKYSPLESSKQGRVNLHARIEIVCMTGNWKVMMDTQPHKDLHKFFGLRLVKNGDKTGSIQGKRKKIS